MISQRWKKAQKAQKNFWQSKESMSHINEKYWHKMIHRGFNLNFEFFNNKDVLEVGCGATGLIFFLENAKSRIGIEPMDMTDLIDDWKKPLVRKGVGEQLPFESHSFDIVICFSVLEHTLNPAKIIQEVHRVLRDKGEFLLWFHTLQNQYKFLQGILNKVDLARPHHFTLNEILKLVFNINTSFEVKEKKIFKGLGLPLNCCLPFTGNKIKNLIGSCMMNDVWLWLRKI
jgi:ubiquinone/menaquinone biosynthesis C-methylase UbiE